MTIHTSESAKASSLNPTTYVLFDEAGKIWAGRVLSQSQNSCQVELSSGKRQKVKASHVLLGFDHPEPQMLLNQAQALVPEIDLNLAWEFAPLDEFSFVQVAHDYFGNAASVQQQAAMLCALHASPHYFRRGASKSCFKKADAATLALALAALEKKKEQLARMDEWAAQLAAGVCPDSIKEQLYKILFKPDKNAPQYKALVQAARQTQKPPLVLLQLAGALGEGAQGAYQFHWQRFLFEVMPEGLNAAKPTPPASPAAWRQRLSALPLAPVQAFSIDDSATTEIDDALSVQGLGTAQVTLGIHIAAPALVISPGDLTDQLARQQLSTIYMPGHKITMLPDAVIEPLTLLASADASGARAAVSLYVTYDASSLALIRFESRLERVHVQANLRYDQIDHVVTPAWLSAHSPPQEPADPDDLAVSAWQPQLSWLYQLAQHLKAQREAVRGKPESFHQPDYSFKFDPEPQQPLTGQESVQIVPRVRGAPLDLIVAECMIVANSTWGGWLASLGVPAIYRTQASLGFGVKVRMGTRALAHAGMGVPSYAWSTSPLRRYVDLVNQWQLLAAIEQGTTAALVAPFKPKDASLLAIIAQFEEAYAQYQQFQRTMERYWTLRYIEQQGIQEIVALVVKDGVVRAQDLPLMLSVLGTQDLPRAARVRVRLGAVDLMALELQGTLIERLPMQPLTPQDDTPVDAQEESPEDETLETLARGIHWEMDVAPTPEQGPSP